MNDNFLVLDNTGENVVAGSGSNTIVSGSGNDVITNSVTGNDVITDFDTDNFRGGGRNFDTLSFTFKGEDYDLSTGRDFVNFVRTIERDGDSNTDAIRDGDDLIFVFARDEDGNITNSIRLQNIIGDDGITDGRLNRASIDDLSGADIFVNAGEFDDEVLSGTDNGDGLTAVDDIRETDEDITVTLAIFDLLANDFDVENNSFQLTSIENVNGGTAELDGLGNVIFTPEANYSGEASFDYTVRDLFGSEDHATVTVNIAAVNDTPAAAQDSVNIDAVEDKSFVYTISDTFFSDIEGDEILVTANGFAGTGLPEWIEFDGQTLSGTPPRDFSGDIFVELVASDGVNETVVPVTISVAAVNDRPTLTVPLPDRFVTEDEAFDIGVPLNAFYDVDGDSLAYRATRPDGTVLPTWIAFDAVTGRLAGTPPTNFSGEIEVYIL